MTVTQPIHASVDVRNIIVEWAKWGVSNRAKFTYTEGAQRMADIGHANVLPITADCSAFVTLCYNFAGAPDPNGRHYDHEGYTGTLLSTGKHIQAKDVIPGDVVVYGPGTGWHTALVVEVDGADILTISHGQQGDPSYVWVNAPKAPARGFGHDGREPQTFLRFPTMSVLPVHVPTFTTEAPKAPITAPAAVSGTKTPKTPKKA